ncbi:MAG: ferritin-like domain-containing protein [Labilithrix sp.]|nr:ferritin-like domain-containing protein [Labilithrix sp.]
MVNEYTSTTVFSQLAAQLVEANATLDATAVVLRMAQDELRHSEICGRVVRAMGGSSQRTRDTRVVAIARHPGCSEEERALRNVIFTTCLSEMNSVAYFVMALERMTDPYVRHVTRSLLADEVLHGRFGFTYLEAWADWLEERPEVRASIGRYLRFAFAVVEREFAAGEHRDAELGRDDESLGVVPVGAAAEVFRETMLGAVVPGLERFDIPAEDAWRRRTLQTG